MQRAADKWELAHWPHGLYQLHPMGANLPGEMLLKLWRGGAHNTFVGIIRETIP